MASSLMPPFVEAASPSARGEPDVVFHRQLVVIEQLGFLEPFLRRPSVTSSETQGAVGDDPHDQYSDHHDLDRDLTDEELRRWR
jgi:hypothetical protein